MSTISDLNKSISEMSEEELFDRLRQVRTSRRTQKPRATSKKSKAKTKAIPKTPDEMLSLLNDAQVEELLMQLTGETNAEDEVKTEQSESRNDKNN